MKGNWSGLVCLVVVGLLASCGPEPTPTPGSGGTSPQATATSPGSVQTPVSGGTARVVQTPTDLRANGPNNLEYLEAQPMEQRLRAQKGAVDTSRGTNVPVITWGAEAALIWANGMARTTQSDSIFANEGLAINLFREDNFDRQVEAVVTGFTPYLRGTVGMANCALEALDAYGIKMVPIIQLSRSAGGDTAVVLSDVIQQIADLRGQTIAVQRCGPHVDFLARILKDAGVSPSDVNIKWMRELTLPPYDSRGIGVDPLTAMQRDPLVTAAMMISPDMLVATAGGSIGTGGESVLGAKMLVSSRALSNLIIDVYYGTEDYLNTHRNEVQAFVHGTMRGIEEVQNLQTNKQPPNAE